jgi:prepilin-type N-terminal cleavage/methylation domain-containing protein
MTSKATMMMTRRQDGFSLVELMVAMTVTLIVSGAIYGLLASGSNAFRREPEVADRQQNIRIAMDLISRDVFNAGAALPPFSQVFTRADLGGAGLCTGALGVNGCGDPGSLGPAAAGTRAPGDGGDPSSNSDVLQLLSTDENCPALPICDVPNPVGTAGIVVARQPIPACISQPGVALLTNAVVQPADQLFTVQTVAPAGASPQACPGGGGDSAQNGVLTLGAPLVPWGPAGTIALPVPGGDPNLFLYGGQVVRYRVAASPDPQDQSPVLWRSATGLYDTNGVVQPEPGEPGFPGAGSPWQLVARGIEDLQVEYMGGDGQWHNLPPVAAANDWNGLVRQVRITLSARVTAANLQGETAAAGTGPNAIRGELTTVVSPRAAFRELQMGNQIR